MELELRGPPMANALSSHKIISEILYKMPGWRESSLALRFEICTQYYQLCGFSSDSLSGQESLDRGNATEHCTTQAPVSSAMERLKKRLFSSSMKERLVIVATEAKAANRNHTRGKSVPRTSQVSRQSSRGNSFICIALSLFGIQTVVHMYCL
jgi:hypothetical protein